MKKIILYLLLINSFSFAQLVKPVKIPNVIISDSLSLKYLHADSTNIWGGNGAFPKYSSGNGLGNLILGLGAAQPILAGFGNYNILLGASAGYAYNDVYYYSNNIFIGQLAGSWLNNNSSTQLAIYNIAIGQQAGANMASQLGDTANYNINIGYHTGFAGYFPHYVNLIGYNAGFSSGGNSYSNVIGANSFIYSAGCSNVNILGNNIYSFTNQNVSYHATNSTFIGDNLYLPQLTNYNGQMILSSGAYFPKSNFFVADLPNDNLKIKGIISIDSTGKTLQYHSTPLTSNRTAGIDSLLNGTDTVFTTAYDANSLIFITDLSPQGTPGHQYVSQAISVPGSYFVVKSMSATDNSKYNWFILKTY